MTVSSIKRGELAEKVCFGRSFLLLQQPLSKTFEVGTLSLACWEFAKFLEVVVFLAVVRGLFGSTFRDLKVCTGESGELLDLSKSSLVVKNSKALEMGSSFLSNFFCDNEILPNASGGGGEVFILSGCPVVNCEAPLFYRMV